MKKKIEIPKEQANLDYFISKATENFENLNQKVETNKFKEESYSVNAASCEFLEFLVNIISDGELLINVANEINRPLLNLLDTAIESNDEVMQVQLLAIIKILDFNTSAQNYNQDKKNIILSKNLYISKDFIFIFFLLISSALNFS